MRKKKPCDLRVLRKKIAAERTAWNTYSIHDRAAVYKRVKMQMQLKTVIAQKFGLPLPTGKDALRAMGQQDRRYARFCGTHRYAPHQDAREMERRRRQMHTGEFAHVY